VDTLAHLRVHDRRRSAISKGGESAISKGGETRRLRRFDTVEELRLALLAFQRAYNQSWIIERHGYRTPAQVRADQIGQLPMAA
jgi:hypothetical protein